jgi:tripartite-type tricarboxylate transporter receptor subunit TctC
MRSAASSFFIALLVAGGLFSGCGAEGGEGRAGEQDGGGDYPKEDIEFIIPYSPGGGYDTWVRTLAPFIEKHLPNKVTVVPKNVDGAGGLVAANRMFGAKPDGTQIQLMDLLGLTGAQIADQAEFEVSDFTWLGTVTTDPRVIVVNPKSEVNGIEDLKASGQVTHALTGFTGSDGVATVAIYDTFGVDYKGVLHDGNDEARLSVIRGDTDANLSSVESVVAELESGDLKPILYVGEPLEPGAPGYEQLKDVETVADLGEPQLNVLESPRVIGAPPGLPDEMRRVLGETIQKALDDPEFKQKAKKNKLTPQPLDPSQTTELVEKTLDSISAYEKPLKAAAEGQ